MNTKHSYTEPSAYLPKEIRDKIFGDDKKKKKSTEKKSTPKKSAKKK